MKKFSFILFLFARICLAHQPDASIPPSSQSHSTPPWIQQYTWDTISNNWVYVKTIDMTYSSLFNASYTHDTVTATPIGIDTTTYDSLGRITALWSYYWNGVWITDTKTEYIYTDTTALNKITFRYAGNGLGWTLILGDSVYNILDSAGNSIDKYFYQ